VSSFEPPPSRKSEKAVKPCDEPMLLRLSEQAKAAFAAIN
jgi:hypothetical protein